MTKNHAMMQLLSAAILLCITLGCEQNSQLVTPQDGATVRLVLVFPTRQAGAAVAAGNFAGVPDAKSEHGRSSATQIDRVTVSVEDVVAEEFVITDQALMIVQTEDGPVAEGDLSLPVEQPQRRFIIEVTAFEQETRVAFGSTNITLSPGQVADSVAVLMRQFPIIFNATQTLTGVNDCDLQDGQAFGSSFRIDFNYSDQDGDVLQGYRIDVTFQFSIGSPPGSFDATPFSTNNGTGAFGTMITNQCYRFTNSDSVRVTLVLTDAGGLSSAPLTIAIPRPQGGNRPPGMAKGNAGQF